MADNLPEPKSRKESYLAKAAGMDVTIPEAPESRLEQYLEAIAEGGGGGGTSNFNDLTNRPKYNGTAMTGETNIPEVKSDFIELTSSDYDYPEDNPDGVAIWNLPVGFYKVKSPAVKIYFGYSYEGSTNMESASLSDQYLAITRKTTNYPQETVFLLFFRGDRTGEVTRRTMVVSSVKNTTHALFAGLNAGMLLRAFDIRNDLNGSNISTDTAKVLSAYQGYLLNQKAVGTTETYTIASGSWSALSSSDPYTFQATVTATHTISSDTIAELLNNAPVTFATYGFAIGSISGQSVTIYSIGQPSANVTLKVNYKG